MRVRTLSIVVGVLAWLWVAPADAASVAVMFERDTDAGAGSELAFVSFASQDDVLAGTGGTSVFSQINVAAGFDTTGITWDGSAYRLMFERTTDAGAGSELAFVSFSTWDDVLAGTGGTSVFSQINVAAGFDTTGITWDGSAYRLMFERTTDAGAGSELAFVSFGTWDEVITGTGGTSVFSQINVAAGFDTTGITWDGSAYRLMFERTTDAGAGSELAFVSFSTWDDVLAGTGGTSVFSQINVAASFTTTGLVTLPDPAPPPGGGSGDPSPVIPEPGAIALFAAGLAVVVASPVRRRKSD